MIRMPDPPELPSLSPEDAEALRLWASRVNQQVELLARNMTAANTSPFWAVAPTVYPARTLGASPTLSQLSDAFGTLVKDLKAKGVIA